MRRALLIVIASLLLPAFAACPASARALYVSDEAGVLSDSTEWAIAELGGKLDDATRRPGMRTGAQVAVVTVPSLQGETVEMYALKRARGAGLGDWNADNGALILVATGERKLRIEVGYGLEGVLPDSRCQRVIDEVLAPRLKAGAFDMGVWEAYQQVVGRVADDAGVRVSSDYQPRASSKRPAGWDAASTWVCLGALGFAVLFAGLTIMLQRLMGGSSPDRWDTGARGYREPGGWGGGSGGGGGSGSGGGGGFGGGGASGDY